MSILTSVKKYFPIIFVFFPIIMYFFTNCISSSPAKKRTDLQIKNLISNLGTQNIKPCNPIDAPIDAPAHIRSAQIISEGERSTLVLESIFRDAVKTLWQPLNPNNTPQANSFVIGLKNQSFVTDFKFSTLGNSTWAYYRFKVSGREIYKGAIERIINGEFVKMEIPNTAEDSVQQIWLIPIGDGSGAHVITRSNSTLDSVDETGNSLLTWFTIQGTPARVRKIADTSITLQDFLPQTFLKTTLLGDDPIAIGTASQGNEQLIKITRPFHRSRPQVTLHSDSSPISSLVSFESEDMANRVHLAWLREAPKSVYPDIMTSELTFQKNSQQISYVNARGLREYRSLRTTGGGGKGKLQIGVYTPPHMTTHLKYRFKQNQGNKAKSILLTWHASLDNDFAYMQMPVNTNKYNNLSQSVAIFYPQTGTKLLGTGYLPKGEYGFVVSTNPEKYEQQKPSRIQLCSFPDN